MTQQNKNHFRTHYMNKELTSTIHHKTPLEFHAKGTSVIRLYEYKDTDTTNMGKVVRHGDTISPKLFAVCLENTFTRFNWTTKQIKINGD